MVALALLVMGLPGSNGTERSPIMTETRWPLLSDWMTFWRTGLRLNLNDKELQQEQTERSRNRPQMLFGWAYLLE